LDLLFLLKGRPASTPPAPRTGGRPFRGRMQAARRGAERNGARRSSGGSRRRARRWAAHSMP